MGEIADSMINGECCESCGEYLGSSIGYPRQCNSCKPNSKNKIKAVNGLFKFLNKWESSDTKKIHIIIEYAEYKFTDTVVGLLDLNTVAIKIQEDFPSFVKWVKQNIQTKSNN